MPRSKTKGRPVLPDHLKKYVFSIRLTDAEREMLEKEYGTVQKGIEYFLQKSKK